jgi:hypothetical protein
MADTTLYSIRCNEEDYILITDNGGQNGTVYRKTDRIESTAADSPPWGLYEEGVIWRHGAILGPGIINPKPLPDSKLAGYPAIKRNSKAVFRYLTENN